ncbi:MAG: hypothetical protein ACU0BN_19565 [Sulfitobacter sp.]
MLIIKGTVIGVADKGEGDKRWAIVALQTTSLDRDGFQITQTIKARVFGDAMKGGLHNAYRQLAGVEVFAPVTASVNDRYSSVDYMLAGIPLRLQEARPVQSASAGQPAPAKAAGAN